jgi:hypothetical protein
MCRCFSFLAFLVIGALVLGFCRDWVQVSEQSASHDDVELRVRIDRSKIRSDLHQARDTVKSVGKSVTEFLED